MTAVDPDEGLLDFLACVEAVRGEDMAGLAVILRYANLTDALVAAAKLLAVSADRSGLDREALLRAGVRALETP